MNSKSARLAVGVLVPLIVAGSAILVVSRREVLAADDTTPGMIVQDYEVGVRYDNQDLGYHINPCNYADDYSEKIDWGDGTGDHQPSRRGVSTQQVNGATVVPKGKWPFGDSHTFKATGNFNATPHIHIHCYGVGGGGADFTNTVPVGVWGRITLDSAKFLKNGNLVNQIRVGDTVDLELVLTANAPKSGTRVFVTSSEDVFTNFPTDKDPGTGALYLTMNPMQSRYVVTLTAKKKSVQAVTVNATTQNMKTTGPLLVLP